MEGKPFEHSAESLYSFFSQSGRGFYIPFYQRNYSWDEENAHKLVSDLVAGTRRVTIKSKNSVFLGTVILHTESAAKLGVHSDTPNLLTKISNVVDGQQRIASISMLACVLSDVISRMSDKLKSNSTSPDEFQKIAQYLENQLPELRELFCVEVKKPDAQPKIKPIIIRAGDVSSNPVSDQWTLAGKGSEFYRSNTARFLSDYIEGNPIENIETDERVGCVLDSFISKVIDEIESADQELAQQLINQSTVEEGSLTQFMDYPPDLDNILDLPDEEQQHYYSSVLLLAMCIFLKKSCHVVVIECKDESIAFDMFQSLNATGTPLTAFEVFKPVVVKAYGYQYASSIKKQVDRIEKVFEKESSASGKEELTDKVIGSSALVYNGSIISDRFSEERDWLIDTFPSPPDLKAEEFMSCLAGQAEYRDKFIRPRKPNKNSTNFGLISELQKVGLDPSQADLAALSIFYLRDAGHQAAHTVISLFYIKLLDAQENLDSKKVAVNQFLSICKATAAFFTLWMGAIQGRFPDKIYKNLFKAEHNISIASGGANQTDEFVKKVFRDALESEGVYDRSSVAESRRSWVDKAKENTWYSRKAVCRFALLVSSNDAAPNLDVGKEGFCIDAKPGSALILNCRKWYSDEIEVIEHVATRDQPTNIKHPDYFDENIYPGNKSIVDKIGNLTLLSSKANSSVYSEWPDKAFYYWSLTMPQSTTIGPTASALKDALGIKKLPPALSSLSVSSVYLAHIAPLAYRGTKGLKWDAEFIDKRSEHLCERVFDYLDKWLR